MAIAMAVAGGVAAARGAAAAPASDDDEVALRRWLRADKLALALAGHPLLPDGARVTAARLAAAPVWFEDEAPTSRCADGQPRHRLWRYAFDDAHRLVEQRYQDWCGHPPDAAWR